MMPCLSGEKCGKSAGRQRGGVSTLLYSPSNPISLSSSSRRRFFDSIVTGAYRLAFKLELCMLAHDSCIPANGSFNEIATWMHGNGSSRGKGLMARVLTGERAD
ncbi:unnamed protein product [Hymenolepis diminuta]|uniref:Smr domain-containing protein n=1 Tax=Hymenolepis diminuta TaxID=6216 RepID=A0A0R3SRC6_HYMDI|nr:unnamed protein product [Hymenolepis diminuta]